MSDHQSLLRRGLVLGAVLFAAAACAPRIDAPPKSVVFFTNLSTDLDGPARGAIAEVVKDATDHPSTRVLVKGFSDLSQGGTPSLSQRRAQVVADALVQGGVASSRITQVPRGSTQADPGIESRRVEIELVR